MIATRKCHTFLILFLSGMTFLSVSRMPFNSKFSVPLRSLSVRPFRSNTGTTRPLSSLPNSDPFNVLFLGRDEFSVLVLEQLYQHRGTSQAFCQLTCSYKESLLGRCMESNQRRDSSWWEDWAKWLKTFCLWVRLFPLLQNDTKSFLSASEN